MVEANYENEESERDKETKKKGKFFLKVKGGGGGNTFASKEIFFNLNEIALLLKAKGFFLVFFSEALLH